MTVTVQRNGRCYLNHTCHLGSFKSNQSVVIRFRSFKSNQSVVTRINSQHICLFGRLRLRMMLGGGGGGFSEKDGRQWWGGPPLHHQSVD
jgi:hypothetical protein